MRTSYYNTNRESGVTLRKSEIQAQTQEDIIAEFFREHPTTAFSPHQIHNTLFGSNVPLTSIRRAMTNLTDLRILKKTPIMRMGNYGKYVHTWRLDIKK